MLDSRDDRGRFGLDIESHGPPILEDALRSAVSDRLGVTRFALWFGGNVRLGLNRQGDSLVVRVPDIFFRDWIKRHYTPTLMDAVEAVVGQRLNVSVQIYGECEQYSGKSVEPVLALVEPNITPQLIEDSPALPSSNTQLPQTFTSAPTVHKLPTQLASDRLEIEQPRKDGTAITSGHLIPAESSRRPLRQLKDYVTGPGNRVAFAAAIEVARTAGVAFNPLLIYGTIGLGKSHLLEGISHSLRQFHPRLQIIQLNAERFTNSFLESMHSGSLSGFRARFRSAGGLIVDDVQFLAAKRATMLEFLYTFDALFDKGCRLSSQLINIRDRFRGYPMS